MGFSGMGVETVASVGTPVGVAVGARGVEVASRSAVVGLGVWVLGVSPQTLTPEMEFSVAIAFPELFVWGYWDVLLLQLAINKTSNEE